MDINKFVSGQNGKSHSQLCLGHEPFVFLSCMCDAPSGCVCGRRCVSVEEGRVRQGHTKRRGTHDGETKEEIREKNRICKSRELE